MTAAQEIGRERPRPGLLLEGHPGGMRGAVRGLGAGALGLAVELLLVAVLAERSGLGPAASASIALTAAILAFYGVAGGLLDAPVRAIATYRAAAGVLIAVGLAGLGLAMLALLLMIAWLELSFPAAHALALLLALAFIAVALADLFFPGSGFPASDRRD